MNRKKLNAVFAWFQEHNVSQHVTFCSMLAYILSVTGLSLDKGISFLVLNLLSGLWLIFRLYQVELLPMTAKRTEGSVMAVMSPTELREMVCGFLSSGSTPAASDTEEDGHG